MIGNRIINFNRRFLKTIGGGVGFIIFGGNPYVAVRIGPYHISLDFSEAIERGYRIHIHQKRPMHRILTKFISRVIQPIATSVVELCNTYGIVVLAGFDSGGYPRIVYHDTTTGDYYMLLEEKNEIIPVIKD